MTTSIAPQTLAQRVTEGRIPVREALHFAMSLAEGLRKIHDTGRFHGAVTPSSIVLTAAGIELIPALAPPAVITPYTAPEVLQGSPADSRSDIFAFGAIVYEMLTGRQAFEGDGQTALTLALTNSNPEPSGSPAVDRLVASCVAKNPAARWQRMQKIIMELKLLTVAARRADAALPARAQAEAAIRAEIHEVEARMTARLAAHEQSVNEMQGATVDALNSIREQLAVIGADLAAAKEKLAQPLPKVDEQALSDQIVARVQPAIDAASQGVSGVEHGLNELRQNLDTLQKNIGADFNDFEQTLKAQSSAIDSARTAMSQTDDLVERVVEAIESLQSTVLEQQGERSTVVN